MNFKHIEFLENKVILKDIKDFNIKQICESGQCFRWKKEADNRYIGVAYERVLEVEQIDNDVILHNTNEEDFKNIWLRYFDLETDYSKIKEELSKDEILRKSVEYGYGIRILNQEPFELVVSFIISARNSIPVISKTINNICERWGNKIIYKGKEYYTFPRKEVLAKATLDEIKEIGGSFRSKYIVDTVNKIYKAELIRQGKLEVEEKEEFIKMYDLERIMNLSDDECHKALQNYMGIGSKVADCIMLFSMEKHSAFPVDIWVRRAMMYFYNAEEASLPKIRKFARDKFKELSGAAQQYLFYYARENSIKL